MKGMIKDAGILFLITLIAGLLMGVIYQLTKEPIAIAEEKATLEAYAEVFADAGQYEEVPAEQYSDIVQAAQWTDQGYGGVSVERVMEALDDSGQYLGYVMELTSHEGYGGDIAIAIGIQSDGTLNGIAILSISETPGLGMNAESDLKPQFADKNVESFTYTKAGAMSEDQIDAISGATITTKAVTDAVNAGLYCFQTITQGGGAND